MKLKMHIVVVLLWHLLVLQPVVTTQEDTSEVLIFEDNFNDLDLITWKHEIALPTKQSNQFQTYDNSRHNSFVQDGKLHIRPTVETTSKKKIDLWGFDPATVCTAPRHNGCLKTNSGENGPTKFIKSAQVSTNNFFSFRYGRVEVRAKLPMGDWLRPKIFLKPLYDTYGVEWPKSGQINIMEARGNAVQYKPQQNTTSASFGINAFTSALHFGPHQEKDAVGFASKSTTLPLNQTYADGFHTYGLFWSSKRLYTYVDSPENIVYEVKDYGVKSFWQMGVEKNAWEATEFNPYFANSGITTMNAPFDQQMYFGLHTAVGGSSFEFPENVGGKPWSNVEANPATSFFKNQDKWIHSWGKIKSDFIIDSVKIWGFKGESKWHEYKNRVHAGKKPRGKSTESLIFKDTFENNNFNLIKWKHEITLSPDRGEEFQSFVNNRRNSFVRNNTLFIQPTPTNLQLGDVAIKNGATDAWGTCLANLCTSNYNNGCARYGGSILPPVTSAEIRTAESFSFRYGRVEVVAKLPVGDYIKPVIKLVPLNNQIGNDKLSEIQMLLSRMNLVEGRPKTTLLCTELRTERIEKRCTSFKTDSLSTDFHTYGLYWNAQEIIVYLNEEKNKLATFSINSSKYFKELMYVVVGVSVGGVDGFFPDTMPKKSYSNNDPFPIAVKSFYNAMPIWYNTWKPVPIDNSLLDSAAVSAFQIKSIQIWGIEQQSEWKYSKAFDVEETSHAKIATAEEIVIFEDNFNTDHIDLKKWKPAINLGGNGNREFQMFVNSRRTSFILNNTLHLKPALTSDALSNQSFSSVNQVDASLDLWGTSPASLCTGPQFAGCNHDPGVSFDILSPVQSAQLRTAETFSFKYGRVEITAKLPKGDWLWPSLWLMGLDESYGTWPASGEIDIMEARGNGPNYLDPKNKSFGYDTWSSCFHIGSSDCIVGEGNAPIRNKTDTYADDFHVYGLFWDENEMYTYVDSPNNIVAKLEGYGKSDKSLWESATEKGLTKNMFNAYHSELDKNAPFNKEMYLILSLAIGGTSMMSTEAWWPDGVGNKPWATSDPFPKKNFILNKDQWYKTWTHGENDISNKAAFQIKKVKVWGFKGKSTWRYHHMIGDQDDLLKTNTAPSVSKESRNKDYKNIKKNLKDNNFDDQPKNLYPRSSIAWILFGIVGLIAFVAAMKVVVYDTYARRNTYELIPDN